LTKPGFLAILASYDSKDFPNLHNDQAVTVYPPDFLDYPNEYGIIFDIHLEGVLTCIHDEDKKIWF
jgi:hypothetical protein